MPRPPADRRALADAGGALLHRAGIQATSVDELADEAGVTKVTLYRHFGSKDALLVEALEHRRVRRQAELEAVLAAGGEDWRAGVLAVFDWHAAFVARPDFRGCAFVQAEIEVGDRVPEVRREAVAHKQAFARAIREHLERANVADAAVLAQQLQLLYEGSTALTRLDGDPAHARHARRAAERLLDAASLA